jgi:ATP-dependent Lon protease
VSPLTEIEKDDLETEAMSQALLKSFEQLVTMSQSLPTEAVVAARNQLTAGRLADFMASLLDIPVAEKQRVLETLESKQRLSMLNSIITHQLQVLEVGQQIQESVRETLDARQREFVLRQQLQAIQKELGEGDDAQRQVEELRDRIEKANMPPEVKKEAERELERLGRMPAQAAEYTVARTYLEWLVDMPWTTSPKTTST